jgi:hypothetical protein
MDAGWMPMLLNGFFSLFSSHPITNVQGKDKIILAPLQLEIANLDQL